MQGRELCFFFFSSRRRHTRSLRDWSSDVCSSDLAAGKPYEVPFSGGVSWLYAGEVASAFIHAVARERSGAPVFDMNGVYAPVEEGLVMLRKLAPSAAITSSGQALAFPMHLPDTP